MRVLITSLLLSLAAAAVAAQDATLVGFGPSSSAAERDIEQRADGSIASALKLY